MKTPSDINDFDDDFRKGIPSAGDAVVVVQGPFESFEGTVVEVDWSLSQAVVEAQIFGKPTPVKKRFQEIRKNAD